MYLEEAKKLKDIEKEERRQLSLKKYQTKPVYANYLDELKLNNKGRMKKEKSE